MSNEPTGAELGKKMAAELALQRVESGMKLGLGSGSTAEWFVRCLAGRVTDGLDVTCVATSRRTEKLAQDCGIEIFTLDDIGRLDLTVDGADEIDPALNLIKGGGGCHLVEKIVAAASAELIVIADDRKLVPQLGAFPLPLEVIPYGWQTTALMIEDVLRVWDVGGTEGGRRTINNHPFETDEKNYILDYHLGRIGEPAALAAALNAVPGVVENGLFINMASRVMIGAADGTAREVLPV
jgi:ribose 5-phosphate isomerase A